MQLCNDTCIVWQTTFTVLITEAGSARFDPVCVAVGSALTDLPKAGTIASLAVCYYIVHWILGFSKYGMIHNTSSFTRECSTQTM